jgi:hypothetical protein
MAAAASRVAGHRPSHVSAAAGRRARGRKRPKRGPLVRLGGEKRGRRTRAPNNSRRGTPAGGDGDGDWTTRAWASAAAAGSGVAMPSLPQRARAGTVARSNSAGRWVRPATRQPWKPRIGRAGQQPGRGRGTVPRGAAAVGAGRACLYPAAGVAGGGGLGLAWRVKPEQAAGHRHGQARPEQAGDAPQRSSIELAPGSKTPSMAKA